MDSADKEITARVQKISLDNEFTKRKHWTFDPRRLNDKEFRTWIMNCIRRFVVTNKGVDFRTLEKYTYGLDHWKRCNRLFGNFRAGLQQAGIRQSQEGTMYVIPRRTYGRRVINRTTLPTNGHNVANTHPRKKETARSDILDILADPA